MDVDRTRSCLSPSRVKLNLIDEKISIGVNYGKSPWQIVPEIIGFRNKIAHGKNTPLTFDEVVPADAEYKKILREFMFADWQKYANKKNAKRVRLKLEELFTIIHSKANIEGDILFGHGAQTGSARLIRR